MQYYISYNLFFKRKIICISRSICILSKSALLLATHRALGRWYGMRSGGVSRDRRRRRRRRGTKEGLDRSRGGGRDSLLPSSSIRPGRTRKWK